MTTVSLIRVANLDELRGDGPHALSANGFDIVAVRTPAGVRAFEGRCPHQGALLGEGELDGDKLVCRNHRWRFSVDSGQREGGPQCLASCPVVERERAIFVDVSGLSRGPDRIVAKRTLYDLPGPRGLPFLGNIHQLDLTKLHLILERWAAQYGPVYLFRKGTARAVVLSDPKWCDQVLRARPETFTRDSGIAPVASEMGLDGVFSAEGDAWRPQRRRRHVGAGPASLARPVSEAADRHHSPEKALGTIGGRRRTARCRRRAQAVHGGRYDAHHLRP